MKLHLIPSAYINSTYDIDFQMLYDNGFRGLIFDIDNTLTQHGAPAKSNATKLFQELDEIGFKYILISNNHEERVAPFAGRLAPNMLPMQVNHLQRDMWQQSKKWISIRNTPFSLEIRCLRILQELMQLQSSQY